MHLEAEVAVIGGGPAGASCAATLARQAVDVLLLDATPAAPRTGEILQASARPMLAALGIDPGRDLALHLPLTRIRSAWGTPRLAETDPIRSPYGEGWSLDRAVFDGLLRAAALRAGARLAATSRVTGLAREDGGWRLALSDGGSARVAWIIDCSGREARWAREAGARRTGADRLVAFVATLDAPQRAETAELLVEAAEGGWWYGAALPQDRRVLAFLTDADLPGAYRARDWRGMAALAKSTTHVAALLVAPFALLSGPAACGAGMRSIDPAAGEGWLAAGDVALAWDPLAGAGIAQALRGGEAAALACAAALRGESGAIASYAATVAEAWRSAEAARAAAYARETRWPWHPFWARRAGAAGGAALRASA